MSSESSAQRVAAQGSAPNTLRFTSAPQTCENVTIDWSGTVSIDRLRRSRMQTGLVPPLYISIVQQLNLASDFEPTLAFFNVHDNSTSVEWKVDVMAGRYAHIQMVDHSGKWLQDAAPTMVQPGADTSCIETIFDSRPSQPSLLPVIIGLSAALMLALTVNAWLGLAALRRRRVARRRREGVVAGRLAKMWQTDDEAAMSTKYQKLDDSHSLSSVSGISPAEAASTIETRASKPSIAIRTRDLETVSTQPTTVSNFVTSPANLLFRKSPYARQTESLRSADERSDVATSDAATIAGSESIFHRSSISSHDLPEPQFFPLHQDDD